MLFCDFNRSFVMRENKAIEYMTYKSVILNAVVHLIILVILSILFNLKDLKSALIYSTSVIIGAIVSLTIVYYFLAERSFRPIMYEKWFALITISFLPFFLISLGVSHVLGKLI